MIKAFHTENYLGEKKTDYFEGWYFRHLGSVPFSLIAGVSKCRRDPHAFIQYIGGGVSAYYRFPLKDFRFEPEGMTVRIGENVFSKRGLSVSLRGETDVDAFLTYGPLAQPRKTPFAPSIMGPLAYLPLSCNHAVVSLSHGVSGTLTVNGETRGVTGTGYIEKDFGSKFPASYFWLHAANEDLSLVAAVARPVALGLTGHFCLVSYRGKEYNLSLYEAGRVRGLNAEEDAVSCRIERGRCALELDVRGGGDAQNLLAPDRNGDMTVTIRENLNAHLNGYFTNGGMSYNLARLSPCAFEVVSPAGLM